MLLPAEIDNPPMMICLQGHATGMHISLGRATYEGDENLISGGDRDFCVRAVKEGYAAGALEQRDFGGCGGFGEKGTRCFEESLTTLLLGRTAVGQRVWDVMRLIDVLEIEFSDKIDSKAICLMGNSGGGTTTAYTVALDDRIALVMPSCTMCAFKDSIGVMRQLCASYCRIL